MELMKRCARDLMKKDVKTIREMDSINKAITTMIDLDVSSLVVERNDDNDAFGMITRKDIVEVLIPEIETGFEAMLVEDIMSKPVITVNPDLSISQCYQMMRMMGVRRMPVVNDKELVGILSSTDLFHYLTKDIRYTAAGTLPKTKRS